MSYTHTARGRELIHLMGLPHQLSERGHQMWDICRQIGELRDILDRSRESGSDWEGRAVSRLLEIDIPVTVRDLDLAAKTYYHGGSVLIDYAEELDACKGAVSVALQKITVDWPIEIFQSLEEAEQLAAAAHLLLRLPPLPTAYDVLASDLQGPVVWPIDPYHYASNATWLAQVSDSRRASFDQAVAAWSEAFMGVRHIRSQMDDYDDAYDRWEAAYERALAGLITAREEGLTDNGFDQTADWLHTVTIGLDAIADGADVVGIFAPAAAAVGFVAGVLGFVTGAVAEGIDVIRGDNRGDGKNDSLWDIVCDSFWEVVGLVPFVDGPRTIVRVVETIAAGGGIVAGSDDDDWWVNRWARGAEVDSWRTELEENE